MVTESDYGPELVVFIPFKGEMRLKAICVIGGGDGECPSNVKLYKNVDTVDIDIIEEKKPLGIGKIAPLFEEKLLKPIDGESTFKLESLRGNVVLIDFWASWCGPCRRENPNVVKTYQKFKDKGFKIVSVSLDSDKKKWKDAIAKDNLIWPYHVSNLGGWKSNVGKLYGVSSIPFTVLIDEEGKIIKTNLRGKLLEDELDRIYRE